MATQNNQTPIPQVDDANARFWTERAAQQRAEAAKRQPYQPTNLASVLQENEEKRKAELAKAQPTEDPWALQAQNMKLPASDPIVKRLKWEHFNPGKEYPGVFTGWFFGQTT